MIPCSKNTFIYSFRKFYWNLHSHTWDDFLDSTEYSKEIEDIVLITDKYKTTNQPILLDLGCATASYSIVFAKRNYMVIGVDYAKNMIQKAEKNARKNKLNNVSFLVSDYNSGLNFNSFHFDFVLSAHTNLGTGSNCQIIQEIKRVLKNRGYLVVVTKIQSPKKNAASINHKIFLRFFLWLIKSLFFSSHRNRLLDVNKIQAQIESNGLKTVSSITTLNNHIIVFQKSI